MLALFWYDLGTCYGRPRETTTGATGDHGSHGTTVRRLPLAACRLPLADCCLLPADYMYYMFLSDVAMMTTLGAIALLPQDG